jgi:hypothetical protein
MKLYLENRQYGKFDKIFEYFENFKAFDQWMDHLPNHSSYPIAAYTAWGIVIMDLFILYKVGVYFLMPRHNKSI